MGDSTNRYASRASLLAGTSKQLFFRLSFREKSLGLVVLMVVLFYWISNHLDRQKTAWSEIGLANDTAKLQRQTLDEQAVVEARFREEIAAINLDDVPAHQAVQGLIDDIIRRHQAGSGFQYTDNWSEPDMGNPLSFRTFRLDLRKVEWESLSELSNELQSSLPYVSLRRTTIRALTDPRFLNATFELRSIEYIK